MGEVLRWRLIGITYVFMMEYAFETFMQFVITLFLNIPGID